MRTIRFYECQTCGYVFSQVMTDELKYHNPRYCFNCGGTVLRELPDPDERYKKKYRTDRLTEPGLEYIGVDAL